MKTVEKDILIHASADEVFRFMDDTSKTGMHMSQNSSMMMGSKLTLEWLSPNKSGVGTTTRWYGKMMGMAIDFTQSVTHWVPDHEKTWATFSGAKIIVYSWYRMGFKLKETYEGTYVRLFISYERPKSFFFRILSFLFAGIYARWCLRNMLRDTKIALEKTGEIVSHA
jgi:hypothetical protein